MNTAITYHIYSVTTWEGTRQEIVTKCFISFGILITIFSSYVTDVCNVVKKEVNGSMYYLVNGMVKITEPSWLISGK
jgi:hypothetical protein